MRNNWLVACALLSATASTVEIPLESCGSGENLLGLSTAEVTPGAVTSDNHLALFVDVPAAARIALSPSVEILPNTTLVITVTWRGFSLWESDPYSVCEWLDCPVPAGTSLGGCSFDLDLSDLAAIPGEVDHTASVAAVSARRREGG